MSRLSLASLDPFRRGRSSRSASIRSNIREYRSISRPSHAARRPKVERNGRRAESRAGEGRDWNSCCSIVLNWWRDTNGLARARARNPSRRSNAISLGASYSRCLSAGTRVSLSAIPRRGDRGESAQRANKSRRVFYAAGERFAGDFDPSASRGGSKKFEKKLIFLLTNCFSKFGV